MSMDEFKISQKQLTEQQRERITRNFRAAKAIRDRKRSQLYNTPPSPSNIWPNHPGPDQMSLDGCSSSGSDFRSPPISRFRKKTHVELNSGEIQRKALSDLNTNTSIRLRTPQNLKGISHEAVSTVLENSYSHCEYAFAGNRSNGIGPGASDQVCVAPAVVSFTEGFDVDFNEALLQEIDDMCGQSSKAGGSILHPTSETPSAENVVSPENTTLLVEGVSGTDQRRPASVSRRFKEENIMGFLSAIFQSPGDVRTEDRPLPSLAANVKTLESKSTAASETCQITAPDAEITISNGLHECGRTPTLNRKAGDSGNVKSVKLSCSAASGRLNPSQPATRCDSPEAAAFFVVNSFSGVESSHELFPFAENTTKTGGVGLASEALIKHGVPECLEKLDSSQRQAATSTDLPKAEASLSANNAIGPELHNRCSSQAVSTTLASEVGLSPAALLDQRVPVYLQTLNSSQREAAVSDITRPLLILAGPGSGKTSTMVARVIHLLEEGTEPKSILAMTFTTVAATEMRERVGAAIGKIKSKELAISTFHSFCLQLCRTHAEKLGRTPEFLVYGSGQQRKAVIEATRIASSENKGSQLSGDNMVKDLPDRDCENMSPSLWREQARKWQQFVTQAKCAGRTSVYYEKIGNILAASVLRNYEKTLAACNALDYHDFITYAIKLLEENQAVLEECQKTWSCILVDEFQDTSSMQYKFLRLLGSHQRITVVGDDDQSIFGFNGANAAGFFSFREDFPNLHEVRLHQNYRSTRCIVEAASALIRNNNKRRQTKQVVTDNILGDKIEVRECRNESAQCSFVADAILMARSSKNFSYGSTAVLYRRQVTGKLFQSTFRTRKIPFNVHGVAFYRKKIIKNIIAVFWTALPGRKDIFSRRAFKVLYGGEKSESKKAVEYIEKISRSKHCDFMQAASEIFTAKVSGTFTRRQLALGKKVLGTINTVKHLVSKEQSLSAVISAVVNLLPQRPIMDTRATLTEDGRRLLNEDEDSRTVLEHLLDDVNEYLEKNYSFEAEPTRDAAVKGSGCSTVLKAFLDYMTTREEENFRSRKEDNNNSVTLTTMHQSKGLEWDAVFIVKANDTEIPLLHEGMGCVDEGSISLEEERRLFYVAITRARKKLYISYIVVDSDRQILRPTRFLAELPHHLLDFQDGVNQVKASIMTEKDGLQTKDGHRRTGSILDPRIDEVESVSVEQHPVHNSKGLDVKDEELGNHGAQDHGDESSGAAAIECCLRTNAFLKGFSVESRSVVAALFHTWAKKPSFQDPKRLLSKVGFVIDERLRSKATKNKKKPRLEDVEACHGIISVQAVLISLKLALRDEAAVLYAQNVLAWEKLPAEERTVLQAERQEHFQMQNSERSSAAAAATPKQISYLRSLGCTVDPSSRLHASRLIEQYKKL